MTTAARRASAALSYARAAAGFPALFDGLTGDRLRQMEREQGTDAVTEFMHARYEALAGWKKAIDQFEASTTPDEEAALRALSSANPRHQAWRAANRAMDDYLAALAATNAAAADWHYDLTGTVTVPTTERPPATIPDGCRIVGCDGSWHYDDFCAAPLGEVTFDGEGNALPAELAAGPEGGPRIVAFAFAHTGLDIRREMRDRRAAHDFAQQLRDLADAIDTAALQLPASN